MDLELDGKKAIVTGGSRGLGRAIALELAREGVDVAVVARTRQPLEEAARELAAATGRLIVPVVADTGDAAAVKQMVGSAVDALGQVDILVNAAARVSGMGEPKLAEIVEDQAWSDFNVKVLGYLRCAQAVAPYMRRQGWGSIISISGMAARRGGSILASARNAAVVAMTKSLADELGPEGIIVTAVHPGTTRTERTASMIAERARREGVSLDEAERRMGALSGINRIIDAREVAYVVAFLASPKAIAINGEVVGVAGGLPGTVAY